MNPSQVLAVFSKDKGEIKYKTIRHVAKGINLFNLNIPQEIQEKLSLEQYIPKS